MQNEFKRILAKAGNDEGLAPEEASQIFRLSTDSDWEEVFRVARFLTQKHFRKRIHFFAPLYFSNYCVNDCVYCGFRRSNRSTERRFLTPDEFISEARYLWDEGHRTMLLIASEHPDYAGAEQIAVYLNRLREEELPFYLIAEVAPMSRNDYWFLSQQGIKQCISFQETYDQKIYASLHNGPKKDFAWRYEAMERALEGGIPRVGCGILLGLAPFQSDFLELMRHARHLEQKFGAFPATLSFPRIRSAQGIDFRGSGVTDADFQKVLAVTRLAIPKVGIVLTTRETPAFRKAIIKMGIAVTHLSAGSSTVTGGYTLSKEELNGQFQIGDGRSLREVVSEVEKFGYQPIFHSWSDSLEIAVHP
ncbi:MAG: radical SAM protein [Candidatus Omnitrophica bacterium]|nr:radical SAM protein [Candidatus Omnitrophota bacterium]MDD5672020.1 radical SAM protein [Candidatus Omnitrophota bacterium]